MKRTLIVALALVMVAGAGMALAGGHGHGHGHGRQCPGMKSMGPGGGAGPATAHRFLRPLRRLNLSEAQWGQVRTIVDAAKPKLEEHMEAIGKIRKQLRDMDDSRFDEKAVRTLAAQLGSHTEALVVLNQQLRVKVHSVLTDEQREQLVKMRERMMDRREHMRDKRCGRGRMGNFPPPPKDAPAPPEDAPAPPPPGE